MIGGRWVFMHQIVAGIRRGFEIDHVDGNGLNNHRTNLRHLTHADNIRAGVRRQKQAILDAQEPELQAWLALHMAR